jgi:hypothetical protein
MTNIDNKPRRWSIWQVTQLPASEETRQYSPVNPKSVHPRGYLEMFGLINNPSFRRVGNRLVSHYEGRVGKVGLDNSVGWVATVDGTHGYVFVERFQYQPGKKYPDDTSAQFWLNAPGEIVCGTNVVAISAADVAGAHLVESEVLSPMASLKPGESYKFHNEWAVANIGGNYPILDCTNVGATCEPLTVKDGKATGRFGVFYTGEAQVRAGRKTIATIPVSPNEPLVLNVPTTTKSVKVIIVDATGKRLGELK